jgi:5-methylcytosine-specific restriction endonuclease McrA
MASWEWSQKRAAVWERANGVCERCGRRRGAHVHHLIYGGLRKGQEPLEWLQLVCLDCHGLYHPNHRFRTPREQKAIAARRAKRRKWRAEQPEASCQHCGGAYKRSRHKAICVKYGLDKPNSTSLARPPRPGTGT